MDNKVSIPSSSTDLPTDSSRKLPDLTAIPRVETSVRQPTFCVSSAGYISILNPWLEYNGLEKLNIDDMEFYDSVNLKACTINFGRGFSFNFYTTPKNDELVQIVYRLDLDAAEENTKSLFFDISKATVYGLDFDNAESILTMLDYPNLTDGVKKSLNKNLAGYSYSVDRNIVTLFIMANSN